MKCPTLAYEDTLCSRNLTLPMPSHALLYPLLLLAASASSSAHARARAPPYITSLSAVGANSIRVRVAAPGQSGVSDPPISALRLPTAAPTATVPMAAATTLINGNLRVNVDPGTGLLTAVRLSDNVVVLKQMALEWSPLDNSTAAAGGGRKGEGVRPGSLAATVRFAGTAGESVYGLGEHKTGTVQRSPYTKVFADSLYYGKSGGADGKYCGVYLKYT